MPALHRSLISLSAVIAVTFAGVVPAASAAPGEPVGAPIRVSDSVGSGADDVQFDIARNAAGEFVVVWSEPVVVNPFSVAIRGRLHAADGTPAGPEFTVASDQRTDVRLLAPRVSMNAEGDFVVVWERVRPGVLLSERRVTEVQARRYAAGGVPLGGEQQIAPSGGAPDVAMDDDGDFTAVWAVDGRISGFTSFYGVPLVVLPGATLPDRVVARRYNAEGRAISLPLTLDSGVRRLPLDFNNPAVARPEVTGDGAGRSLVVWTRDQVRGSERATIRGRRLSARGLPEGAEIDIDGDLGADRVTGASRNVNGSGAAVAMNRNGQAVVAWRSDGRLQARTMNSSGALSATAIDVGGASDTAPLALTARPSLAIDAVGNFAVSALNDASFVARQNLRVFAADGSALSPPVPLSTATTARGGHAIAMDDAGNIVSTFERQSGIDAQRFAGP